MYLFSIFSTLISQNHHFPSFSSPRGHPEKLADKQISVSTSQLKCGFWDVTLAVVDAKSRLEFQKVLGYNQACRAAFGTLKSPSISGRNSNGYKRLISDLVCEVDENKYQAKSVELHLQGY